MDSFERQWQRWFPEDKQKKKSSNRHYSGIVWIIGIVVLLFIIANFGKSLYTDWLWFSDLGYASVFTRIIASRVLIFVIAAFFFCLFFLGNIYLALRLLPKVSSSIWPWEIVRKLQPVLRSSILVAAVILSLLFGLIAQGSWESILLALNWQPFGVTDPAFNREVGFYVFSLPFLGLLRGWLSGAFIISLLGTAAVYFTGYSVQRLKFNFPRRVTGHLGGLLIAILGLFAWGYWLGIWELVFSQQGIIFGAGYADMHAKLPAQWILIGIVVLFALVILVSIFRRNYRLVLYGLGAWVIAAILIGTVYPAVIQRFQVQPNELARETPYINDNIEFTRAAFSLNAIDEKSHPGNESPTLEDITSNEAAVSNIRIWDHRPLKDTFNHIQSLRTYYDFLDVDIDRYLIDGEYRQVMLSARELSIEKLPDEAKTWVNRRLVYTHGYGVTLTPVNEVDAQGLPVLMVQDIPPAGKIEISQPGIYFGEKTNDYVIVNTNTQEFDYPAGNENVFTTWQGTGGISLDGFFRRLAYAWELGDFNILISGELTSESRILYHRNIQERVSRLAPFLLLDNDPYIVIIDGRLFWVQDAYTATDRYPYSTPYANRLNYIRNSVKVVIDAYNGDVTFYVADPEDAIIRTYQAIFPEMFASLNEMPEQLQNHLRYPEGLFNIQAQMFLSYHMTDTRVFYNKEDLWQVPREVYFGNEQAISAYYIIMRLPEENREEFLLMIPFTPADKRNTIGWLAARCDGDNYGNLLTYRFPKEQWVDGPSQVENRIGQDTVITEQLALWGRGGSTVIRGNLLLIPIGDSILYVEPVFLQAEGGGLPELKRVIIATSDKVVMMPSLAESLAAIFGQPLPVVEETETGSSGTPAPETPLSGEIAGLVARAQQYYEKAQEYVKSGDWAGFGQEWDNLQQVLEELAQLTLAEP